MTTNVIVTQPNQLTTTVKTGQPTIAGSSSAQSQQISASVAGTVALDSNLTPDNKLLVTNYQLGSSIISLESLYDVDAENPEDGSILIYSGTSQIWQATPNVANPNTIINGGNF